MANEGGTLGGLTNNSPPRVDSSMTNIPKTTTVNTPTRTTTGGPIQAPGPRTA